MTMKRSEQENSRSASPCSVSLSSSPLVSGLSPPSPPPSHLLLSSSLPLQIPLRHRLVLDCYLASLFTSLSFSFLPSFLPPILSFLLLPLLLYRDWFPARYLLPPLVTPIQIPRPPQPRLLLPSVPVHPVRLTLRCCQRQLHHLSDQFEVAISSLSLVLLPPPSSLLPYPTFPLPHPSLSYPARSSSLLLTFPRFSPYPPPLSSPPSLPPPSVFIHLFSGY